MKSTNANPLFQQTSKHRMDRMSIFLLLFSSSLVLASGRSLSGALLACWAPSSCVWSLTRASSATTRPPTTSVSAAAATPLWRAGAWPGASTETGVMTVAAGASVASRQRWSCTRAPWTTRHSTTCASTAAPRARSEVRSGAYLLFVNLGVLRSGTMIKDDITVLPVGFL